MSLKDSWFREYKNVWIIKNAIGLVSGPAGFVALIGMLVALMAKLGDNENKLSDLQEKWEHLGRLSDKFVSI